MPRLLAALLLVVAVACLVGGTLAAQDLLAFHDWPATTSSPAADVVQLP